MICHVLVNCTLISQLDALVNKGLCTVMLPQIYRKITYKHNMTKNPILNSHSHSISVHAITLVISQIHV